MVRPILFLTAISAAVLLAQPLLATGARADTKHCLTQDQRRAALASHRAMHAGRAIKIAKRRFAGDVVRARLCEGQHGNLHYVLTVLARDGKVTRVTVDAMSGKLLKAR